MDQAIASAVVPAQKRRRRGEAYADLLGRLSRQSVTKHFDAYASIPWDDPEYRINPEDPRWVRSQDDPLGATRWYQAQPLSVRAGIGLMSICGHMKIGVEFESVLKRGLLEFATTLPSSAPELRYAYHEVIEEAQHSLMFQEFIRRSSCDVAGLSAKLQSAVRQVVRMGRTFPELFFFFVLGGEEPIDHVQRTVLGKREANVHPLVKRIMQIHITEEARHLCFAREYLREHVPQLPWAKRWRLRVMTPIILGEMARLMMQPPRQVIARFGIPVSVVREAYDDNPAHRRAVVDSIRHVRELCEELAVLTPQTTPLWQRYQIYA
jgi:hypothetical protein